MLQGFNWESTRTGEQQSWYQQLSSRVTEFKDLGVTAVWLPPPSDSVSAEGWVQPPTITLLPVTCPTPVT